MTVDRLVCIMDRGTQWFHYVDDILVVMLENSNASNKLHMPNELNRYIQFMVEMEMYGTLPFLDTVIHCGVESAKFSVHRKPTNKDDYALSVTV